MEKYSVLLVGNFPMVCQELLNQSEIISTVDTLRGEPIQEGFLKFVPYYHAIGVRSDVQVDQKVLEVAKNLLIIGRAGSGYDNISTIQAADHGVVVIYTPGENAQSVASLTLAEMIILFRHLSRNWLALTQVKDLKEVKRREFVGRELYGKIVGIIGYGHIGQLVAELLAPFDVKVLVFDPFKKVKKRHHIFPIDSLISLFQQSDIVTVHIPTTAETKNMISNDLLKQIKPNAILINNAREEIVDIDAVKEALKEGKLAGYATDFPPFKNHPIWQEPNFFATSHLGASTLEAEERCGLALAEQFLDFLGYGNIDNSVNTPQVSFKKNGNYRLTVYHRDIPGMVNQVSGAFSRRGINIHGPAVNQDKDIGYLILDVEKKPPLEVISEIEAIKGVIRIRHFSI